MGEYLCPNCFSSLSFDTKQKCLICGKPSWDALTHPICKTKHAIDGYFSAVSYGRVAKKLLYQFKYKPYLSDLQTVMTDLLYEKLVQSEMFNSLLKENPLLVPIPLSHKKLRQRGYNQSELLAKKLGALFHCSVVSLLERTKETKPQYGLKREERMENMKGAFSYLSSEQRDSRSKRPHPSPLLKGEVSHKVGILVDDVVTTGSTLREAAHVLKRNGFGKVFGVAWAED